MNKAFRRTEAEISIARVFLKNPPVLILDKATSALDNESERWIQKKSGGAFQEPDNHYHCPSPFTIRNADEILVVADNGIAERGSHEELLAKNESTRIIIRCPDKL